ncbi:MAG: site-specific tyrosine recombinase XerD [Flavobacteriales bacterium]|nr:site-specific tyrosine recombinase XerD [Flavobacteriales bacterium]
MDWKTALDLFRRYLKLERNSSNNTINSYLSDVIKFQQFLENNNQKTSPDLVSEEEVQQFIYSISGTGISERTQARVISGLKSFFIFLMLDNYREDNPTERLESPKLGIYLPDTLELSEIEKILDSIDLSHPQGHRNKAILETLYGTGIRVSELVNLKISDIHFNDEILLVTGKGNKQRLVPIAKTTIKHINLYLKSIRNQQEIPEKYRDFLFLNRRGKPLTRVMIFLIIKNLVEKCGIEKSVSPHTFRHSYATHLLQNGADIRYIQLLLGHESITTTEVYTHINDKQLVETILKYHPRNAE